MKAKNKKILIGVASLGLVAAIAAGGTFAYLTDETEKRANNFSFPEPISAMLTEPNWDGVVDYIYPDDPDYPETGFPTKPDGKTPDIIPVYGWTADPTDPAPIFGYNDTDDDGVPDTAVTTYGDPGTGTPPDKADEYGNTTNEMMVPGQSALKNPIITNTSNDIDEWVAARVSFVYASGTNAGKLLSGTDMQAVLDNMTIEWKTAASDNWELIKTNDDKTQYTLYYKKILNKRAEDAKDGQYGGVTDPMFTSVKVNDDVTNEGIKKLNAISGGFDIYIEGFAVQTSVAGDYPNEEAGYTNFKNWAKTGVTFTEWTNDKADLSAHNGGIVAKK